MTRRALAGALAALALGGAPAAAPAQEPGVYGRADYRWTLRPLDGEEVELRQFGGEVLFINFWATWCRPCVAELASIQRLHESLRGAGVRFLLVTPEGAGPVRRFVQRHGYDLPVYLEAQRIPPAYGLRALPTTWVVDRAGTLVMVHRGAARWDTERMRDFLRSLADK